MPNSSRRSPAAGDRVLDPEKTKRRLLDAALEEFSSLGYDGARVASIAARAGVNKQMISYHFGGKKGLYRTLHDEWVTKEARMSEMDVPLSELAPRYVREAMSDSRGLRLKLWQSLADDEDTPLSSEEPDDLAALRLRQSTGELAGDLDSRVVLLMLTAAVAAPVILPHEVARIFGMDPYSDEFVTLYAEQLAKITEYLAGNPSRNTPTGTGSTEDYGDR